MFFELKEKHWAHRNYNTNKFNKAIENDDLSSTKHWWEALVLPPMKSTMPASSPKMTPKSFWCPNQYMTVTIARLTRKCGMPADTWKIYHAFIPSMRKYESWLLNYLKCMQVPRAGLNICSISLSIYISWLKLPSFLQWALFCVLMLLYMSLEAELETFHFFHQHCCYPWDTQDQYLPAPATNGYNTISLIAYTSCFAFTSHILSF